MIQNAISGVAAIIVAVATRDNLRPSANSASCTMRAPHASTFADAELRLPTADMHTFEFVCEDAEFRA